MDLSYNVTFHNDCCIFLDKDLGRTIGHAREWNDLYNLEEPSPSTQARNLSHSFMSEFVLSNKVKIFLFHCRLGHLSFRIIKFLFPSLFTKVDVESLHCDVSELAKHKQFPFPLSKKVAHFIHTDV